MPKTFTPMGVRTPVVNMSMRVLIGMVQALVQPGSCMRSFISAVSSSQVSGRCSGQSGRRATASQPGAQPEYQRRSGRVRQRSTGLSRTVVSTIDRGAGSVADSTRPILPNTDSTSGKERRMRSWIWSWRLASSIEMLGKVIGMYRMSPSLRGGMNSWPSREATGTVDSRANRPIATVDLGRRRAT